MEYEPIFGIELVERKQLAPIRSHHLISPEMGQFLSRSLSRIYALFSHYLALFVLLPRPFLYRLRTVACPQLRRLILSPSRSFFPSKLSQSPPSSSSAPSPWGRPADVDETVWNIERYVANSPSLEAEHARLSSVSVTERLPSKLLSSLPRRLDDAVLSEISQSIAKKQGIDEEEPVRKQRNNREAIIITQL
jgi:hypothetical protein